MTVTLSRDGNVAIVTIDNSPINAMSQSVRQGLLDTLHETEADPQIGAVVLTCAGRTFIAGADITEFDKPPVAPYLPDLLAGIERATRPWVAAIHGSALGGGLETALVCSHRIATGDAKLGFPEVNLGLIPGAGGTVRLPWLVPAETVVTMIAGGKPVTAREALKFGLIDAISDGDLVMDAVALARNATAQTRRTPPIARATLDAGNMDAFEAAASKIIAKARGQNAPKAAVDAVRNALTAGADEALAAERERFLALRDDPQSSALRHIFFAERATTRDDRIEGVAPRKLGQIGVVGGGTMGVGIATACLLSGYTVTMVERNAEAAEAGKSHVVSTLAGSLTRGRITEDEHARLLRAFKASEDYAALSKADLVVEAVFEDIDVKKKVFAELEAVVGSDTILATNTSYLDIDEIAGGTRNPANVVGLHFFSPAHIMKLLEIVVPHAVSPDVLSTAVAFARQLRKIPVLAGVCDGFIANRIMSAYRREAEYMLEDGAFPWDIDAAMTAFGLPMGVFQMQDMAGLDISWAMRKQQAASRDPDRRYVDIGDMLCEQGRFGYKSGAGYYTYEEGKPVPDPDVAALIEAESARKGIVRRPLDEHTIMARILATMQSEGRAVVKEGIARCANDVDVVMVNAYGFPRWKGGPMFMASQDDDRP